MSATVSSRLADGFDAREPDVSLARRYWMFRWYQEVVTRVVAALRQRGAHGPRLRRLARVVPAAGLVLALSLPGGALVPGAAPGRLNVRVAPAPAYAAQRGRPTERLVNWRGQFNATAPGVSGSIVFGAESHDISGYSVSHAGDVNGDGFDDLLIGAIGADGPGNARPDAGETYLVFGGPGLPAKLDLASLGSAGIKLSGIDAFDWSGTSVSGAGDVNGDGFDDLLIGARYADGPGNTRPDTGESYLIFGSPGLSTILEGAVPDSPGVTFFGGSVVSGAGDVNGDGFDDVLIGSPRAWVDPLRYLGGVSYLVFGAPSLPATLDLASLGSSGVTLLGAADYDRAGWAVSGAGDVNGDGFDDVLIGAPYGPWNEYGGAAIGKAHLVLGGPSLPATIDLASLGSAGVTLVGVEPGDFSGGSVSGAGDVNGDGFDDMLIGVPGGDGLLNGRYNAGESFVVFGGPSLPTTLMLASLGKAGIRVLGADAGDFSGSSVSGAGDVNGDGIDDLLIGALLADGVGNTHQDAGESYLIFGRRKPPVRLDLASLGRAGATLFGAEPGDRSGTSVSGVGDVNGDGLDDVIIGAVNADGPGNSRPAAGETYLVLGRSGGATLFDLQVSLP